MSGTSGGYQAGGSSGAGLPVPHITLAKQMDPVLQPTLNPAGLSYTLTPGGIKAIMQRTPLFSAVDIPQSLIDQGLRLELLRYVSHGQRANGGARSGFAHPSHVILSAATTGITGVTPIAPMLPASRFRGGGVRNGLLVGWDVTTEWEVTAPTQRFFIDSLGDFMLQQPINYVSAAGGFSSTVVVFTPSDSGNGGYVASPAHFGYAGRYRPNYFQFRFSIQDPNDPRARITGPVTPTIACAHSVHPFVQDMTVQGETVLLIANDFDPDEMNCWWSTRLPSGRN